MQSIKFNFLSDNQKGYTNVKLMNLGKLPIYSHEVGYGFIDHTSVGNTRKLSTERIVITEEGYAITETDQTMTWYNGNHFNFGGMAFRIDLVESGAYKIEVTVTSSPEDTSVAVSGLRSDRLLQAHPWDSPGRIPRRNKATWRDHTWSFDYVTGTNFMEIEVEPYLLSDRKPTDVNITVGVSGIVITKLDPKKIGEDEQPTVYLLGDSTVSTYVFEEAGLSGWGQVIDNLFDLSKVNVLNYSMGGRSFKSMYYEGRLNEVLIAGKEGDYVLVQSGHNDESTGSENGPEVRFGRGASIMMYEEWIRQVYVPSIRSRGMIPILITPMTRIDCYRTSEAHIALSGFKYSDSPGIDFPTIMKTIAKELEVPVLNLYEESKKYLKQIGGSAAISLFLSVEAGELPSKTNSGSFANGNPYGRCDGTHFKESLAKQFARIVVTELYMVNAKISDYLKPVVKAAIKSSNWDDVYPEIAKDIQIGENAYYRNQIEKLLQLGALKKDRDGFFYPKQDITTREFIYALSLLWNVEISIFTGYEEEYLTRELMGAILLDAYELKFGRNKMGDYNRPRYMTEYNMTDLSPEDPYYDPNLVGETAQYYPLVGWKRLIDTSQIDLYYYDKVQEAYKLGLIRSEKGIRRDRMENGLELEPKKRVTKEKAAKTLYFLWVLVNNIKKENDRW